MPPIYRPPSYYLFDRLIRGEATSKQYVAALRAQAHEALDKFHRQARAMNQKDSRHVT